MKLEENIPLAPLTTLRIGGPARYFIRVTDEASLMEAVQLARERFLPIFVLGGGSNLVVPDAGFAGLVLHAAVGTSVQEIRDDFVRVDAGVDWDAFVKQMCELGRAGVECLAGIPGLVGGSPVQNIGAYGQEVASTIHTVRALDLETLTFVDLPHADCEFAYRRSIFNSSARDRFIITRVDFHLPRNAGPNLSYADLRKHFSDGVQPTPLEVYHAVRTIRKRKGMVIDPVHSSPDTRSAGSFFKNPVVPGAKLQPICAAAGATPDQVPHWAVPPGSIKLAAAWMIEQAGFGKGYALSEQSPVAISSRHTLALVNRSGTASCAELIALRDHIIVGVERKFSVTLEQEPVVLG